MVWWFHFSSYLCNLRFSLCSNRDKPLLPAYSYEAWIFSHWNHLWWKKLFRSNTCSCTLGFNFACLIHYIAWKVFMSSVGSLPVTRFAHFCWAAWNTATQLAVNIQLAKSGLNVHVSIFYCSSRVSCSLVWVLLMWICAGTPAAWSATTKPAAAARGGLWGSIPIPYFIANIWVRSTWTCNVKATS